LGCASVLATLTILAILLLTNALFVAAEFASVAVRKTSVETLAQDRKDSRARLLLRYIDNAPSMNRLVAASQIGITSSSLFLGAWGEGNLTERLEPALHFGLGMASESSKPLALTLVLVGLTVLQVVVGELVPKAVAVRYPLQVALTLITPVHLFMRLFSRGVDVLYSTGGFFLRLLAVPMERSRHLHSPEEIELLFLQGREKGSIDDEEHRRLRRVLRFGARKVQEVMVPRTRIKSVSRDISVEHLLETVVHSSYTRLPVYVDTIDDIIGFVHVKDVAIALASDDGALSFDKLIRQVPRVPPAMTMSEVLTVMRSQQAQMVIVLDEYGGTEGLVTMENVVEDILGDLQDEFDREAPSVVADPRGDLVVRGDLSLADLSERLEVELEDEDVHTVGGLVMKHLGRAPQVGDQVSWDGLALEVEEVRGAQVLRVRASYTAPQRPVPTSALEHAADEEKP
jgi:putative hemolysin